MKESARYVKLVEWSDEDDCYIGSAPGLIYGGCHGEDEKAVFEELCRIVDEVIELIDGRGNLYRRQPPAATSSTSCSTSRSQGSRPRLAKRSTPGSTKTIRPQGNVK